MINYNIYRCDRSISSSSCILGGGVLVGIRKDILSSLIYNPYNNLERLFVKFSFSCQFIIGGVLYIRPNSPPSLYKLPTDSVDTILHDNPQAARTYSVMIIIYLTYFSLITNMVLHTGLRPIYVFPVFLNPLLLTVFFSTMQLEIHQVQL